AGGKSRRSQSVQNRAEERPVARERVVRLPGERRLAARGRDTSISAGKRARGSGQPSTTEGCHVGLSRSAHHGRLAAAVSMDFTVGPIPRKLALFSLPIMAANLLQGSMQLINGLWVGNLLGSEAFAAVTVATTLIFVVLAFVFGLNNATLTIFAQLRGAGDERGIDAYLGAFVILLAALSAVIGITGYLFAERLLVLLNTPSSILAEAKGYLRINFIATPFLV